MERLGMSFLRPPIRAFLADLGQLSAATRKRKRAAIASFCRWAVRHNLLDANPMDRIDTIKVGVEEPADGRYR
jgi:integrase/recombinase XerC/integrase/recombinase XerD